MRRPTVITGESDAGPRRNARNLFALTMIIALAVAVTACGGDNDAGQSSGSGGLTKLTVGAIPIAPIAPVVIAQDQGFFADEGLDVELDTGAQGGAANLTRVVSGDIQVGFSDVVSLILAADRGIGIQLVGPANAGGQAPGETYSAVVSKKGSGIKGYEDLQGKTIGVNALNNIGDVTIKGALAEQGVSTESVSFVEIPIPQLGAAVEAGRVDAAQVLEPFLSSTLAGDGQAVFYNYVDVVPRGAIAYYFMSTSFIEANGDVADRFKRAMDKATAFAAMNPDAVRAAIPEYTEIPEEAAQNMILPVFDPDQLGREAIENVAALMVEQGLIDQVPDLAALLREGA